MDDEYVQIFLWQNEVAQLPKPSVRVAKVPFLVRVVKSAIAGPLNPVQFAGRFLERHAGNILIDIGQRFYSL